MARGGGDGLETGGCPQSPRRPGGKPPSPTPSARMDSAKCKDGLGEVQPCARRSAALHSEKCSLALREVLTCTRVSPWRGFPQRRKLGKKVQKILNNSMKSMRTRVPHYMPSLRKTRPHPHSRKTPRKNWGYSTAHRALNRYPDFSIICAFWWTLPRCRAAGEVEYAKAERILKLTE